MRSQRVVTTGLAAWLLLAVVAGVTGRGSLVAVLLALAPLVLVPLGIPLTMALAPRAPTLVVVVSTAIPAGAALLLDRGAVAALLVVPWLVLAGLLASAAVRVWWSGPRRVTRLPPVAALGYLTVGAAWLFADRAGIEPLGFSPPFVALTAVHFHHAGFVATTILAAGMSSGGRLAAAATALVVVAPPVVALGFVAVPALLVVGAVLLTAGLWLFAGQVMLQRPGGRSGRLLLVAALAVVVPMALAVHWATGAATGWFQPLAVPTMAMTHGVLQAFGFGLFGLLGRRAAVAEDLT